MASDGSNADGGQWLSSMWGTFSQRLEQTVSTITQDLGEFVDTIQSDTTNTVKSTVSSIKERQGQGMDGLEAAYRTVLDKVKSNLLEDVEQGHGVRSPSKKFDPQPLSSAAYSRSIYTSDPEDHAVFQQWCETFDVKAKTDEISELLSEDDTLRQLHTELIPETVSYAAFWQRHFFQIHLQQLQEQKRKQLLERISRQTEGSDDDAFDDWDDDTAALANDGPSLSSPTGKVSSVNTKDDVRASSPSVAVDAPAEENQSSPLSDEDQGSLTAASDNTPDEVEPEHLAAPKHAHQDVAASATAPVSESADSSVVIDSDGLEPAHEEDPQTNPEAQTQQAVAEALEDQLSSPGSSDDERHHGSSKDAPATTASMYDWDDDLDLEDDLEPTTAETDKGNPEAGDEADDWEDWN